jgi:hypothetical protein
MEDGRDQEAPLGMLVNTALPAPAHRANAIRHYVH